MTLIVKFSDDRKWTFPALTLTQAKEIVEIFKFVPDVMWIETVNR